MIRYRNADWNDVDSLLDLIEKGFSTQHNSVNYQDGKAHRVLFSYLYSLPGWKPDDVAVAEEAQGIIAAVGAFPQQLSFEGLYLPVWAISPVVTHPDHRGKRAAVGCLEFMCEYLKSKGVHAVFLWGIPTYYPKFGFVPVLPRYKTKLTREQLRDSDRIEAGFYRVPSFNEVDDLQTLYAQFEGKLWLQPRRERKWWELRFGEFDIREAFVKEVPFPKKDNFKVWENSSGKTCGYLYYQSDAAKKRIYITEGAARDLRTARSMVQSLVLDMEPGYTLIIRGTPDHYLNAAAYSLGGTHLNPAPLAGMVKILDWTAFLKDLLPVFNSRLKSLNLNEVNLKYLLNDSVVWFHNSSSGWEIELPQHIEMELNRRLTRIVLGLFDEDDMRYFSNRTLNKSLSALFPQKYPFIWDVNYLY